MVHLGARNITAIQYRSVCMPCDGIYGTLLVSRFYPVPSVLIVEWCRMFNQWSGVYLDAAHFSIFKDHTYISNDLWFLGCGVARRGMMSRRRACWRQTLSLYCIQPYLLDRDLCWPHIAKAFCRMQSKLPALLVWYIECTSKPSGAVVDWFSKLCRLTGFAQI